MGVLLNIALETLTFNDVLKAIAILIVIWKAFEEIGKMLEKITERHDREKGISTALEQFKQERQGIVTRYDKRLDELEEKMEENHIDAEAKIQEVRSEQMFMIECLRAVLDGLGQLNCNGIVTETKRKLDEYLNHQAHM